MGNTGAKCCASKEDEEVVVNNVSGATEGLVRPHGQWADDRVERGNDGSMKRSSSKEYSALHLDLGAKPAEVCLPCVEDDLVEWQERMDVNSWLGWSAPKESPIGEGLEKHFPGALPGWAVLHRVNMTLKELGLTPQNTIYGQSFCPDEINNEKGDLGDIMKDYWGDCFPMGGIGGLPYAGKTGFGAFSAHVPKDGHVLLCFGPHIAISETGELGKYLRIGQDKHSTACGACIAGYNQALEGKTGTDYNDEGDMQQSFLRNCIAQHVNHIKSSNNPMAAVAKVTFNACLAKIKEIVNTKFGSGKLALVGGIQINLPDPYEDHFQPLFFEVWQENQTPMDMMTKTFGSYGVLHRNWTQVANEDKLDENWNARLDHFNWLGWSPAPSKPIHDSLIKNFPRALPGTAVLARSRIVVEHLGFRPENTIYGTSICPDEINNEKGELASLMKDYWGASFPMGGIGGTPYVGKTGFTAFSHHVPDGGNILVLFGPHVAISEAGEVGKFLRVGQNKHSTACGACIAAYNDILAGKVGPEFDDAADTQQAFIRNTLKPCVDKIRSSANPMTALAKASYNMVRDEMMKIVNTKFGQGYVVLLGGIMINMPAPHEDHFEPWLFEAHKEESKPIDLLDALFDQNHLKSKGSPPSSPKRSRKPTKGAAKSAGGA